MHQWRVGDRLEVFISLAALLLALLLAEARAEGIRNPPPGGGALGRSGGRVAYIADTTAVLHNPANLVGLERPQMVMAPTLLHYSTDFTSDLAGRAETRSPLKFLPNGFMAAPGPGDWVLGAGVWVPFGASSLWKETGAFGPGSPLRTAVPHSAELKTIQVNPVASRRIGDKVAIAVGFSAMWTELSFRQFYVSPLVTQETEVVAVGDGWSWGANAAISWDVTDRDRVAATVRSGTSPDLSGAVTVGSLNAVATSLGATPRSAFSTVVDFPAVVTLAYGHRFEDALTVEAQLEWVGFSVFDELALDLGDNAVLIPPGAGVLPQRWNDNITAGVGMHWQWSDELDLSLSYQFFESPIPDGTLSTTIPDADQNVVSCGVGWERGSARLSVGYAWVRYDERDVVNETGNPLLSGVFQTYLHIFSAGLAVRF